MTQILKGRFDGSRAVHRGRRLPPELMSDRSSLDAQGRRVLVGLTLAETLEFERLDALPPEGERLSWAFGGEPVTRREKRWLELYRRHNEAWTRRKQAGI